MAHGEEYERYWKLCQWFFGTPDEAERFLREHGTLADFERHHIKVAAMVARDERRRAVWAFVKMIGIGFTAALSFLAIIKGLLPTAWLPW